MALVEETMMPIRKARQVAAKQALALVEETMMPIRKARQVAAELALALVEEPMMPIRKAITGGSGTSNGSGGGTNDADKKDTVDSGSGSKTTEDGTDPSQASTGKMTAVSYTVVTSTTPAPGEGGSDDGNGGSTGDGNGGDAGSNLTPEEQEALEATGRT